MKRFLISLVVCLCAPPLPLGKLGAVSEAEPLVPQKHAAPLAGVPQTPAKKLFNCPLNEGTHGLIGARHLDLMKPTAYLINTARGAIVDQAALVAALRDHKIAGKNYTGFGRDTCDGHTVHLRDRFVCYALSLALNIGGDHERERGERAFEA